MKTVRIALASILIVGLVVVSGCTRDNAPEEVEKYEVSPLEEALPEGYTEEDVNWIGSCQELQEINEDLSAVYALKSDINCSGTEDWNDGKGFNPIGNFTRAEVSAFFTGVFLGRGHKITGIYIDRPNEKAVGLFAGIEDDAVIKNVGVVDVVVSGNKYVGGLAGWNSWGSSVSNSYATGSVSGENLVGGLVGDNIGDVSNSYAADDVSGGGKIGGLIGDNIGDVSNSYATGDVTGNNSVGGLVGQNSAMGGDIVAKHVGSVSGSYATGDVTGEENVGGLVGLNKGDVSNSYATGSLTGEKEVGGLIGYNIGDVSNSYATGSVSGNNSVGGLIGYNIGDVSGSFWDTETSGMEESDGGTGLTTEKMQTKSTFTGFIGADWDFEDTWYMRNYPDLQWNR